MFLCSLFISLSYYHAIRRGKIPPNLRHSSGDKIQWNKFSRITEQFRIKPRQNSETPTGFELWVNIRSSLIRSLSYILHVIQDLNFRIQTAVRFWPVSLEKHGIFLARKGGGWSPGKEDTFTLQKVNSTDISEWKNIRQASNVTEHWMNSERYHNRATMYNELISVRSNTQQAPFCTRVMLWRRMFLSSFVSSFVSSYCLQKTMTARGQTLATTLIRSTPPKRWRRGYILMTSRCFRYILHSKSGERTAVFSVSYPGSKVLPLHL